MVKFRHLADPGASFIVQPSGNTIGADIAGVDFAHLTQTKILLITNALKQRKVLRFDNCASMSDEQQLAFGKSLGTIAIHWDQLAGQPGITRISTKSW